MFIGFSILVFLFISFYFQNGSISKAPYARLHSLYTCYHLSALHVTSS